MIGRSGTEWRLVDTPRTWLDVACVVADVLEREQARSGRTPAEVWAAISANGISGLKARYDFLRRYLGEIAAAMYEPVTPTSVGPGDDLSLNDLTEGIAGFFAVLRGVCEASSVPIETPQATT